MALEVKLLNRIEGKLPGHVASLQKTSVEGTVGLTVMELKPGWGWDELKTQDVSKRFVFLGAWLLPSCCLVSQ